MQPMRIRMKIEISSPAFICTRRNMRVVSIFEACVLHLGRTIMGNLKMHDSVCLSLDSLLFWSFNSIISYGETIRVDRISTVVLKWFIQMARALLNTLILVLIVENGPKMSSLRKLREAKKKFGSFEWISAKWIKYTQWMVLMQWSV